MNLVMLSFISSNLIHTESVNYRMFPFKDTEIQTQTENQTGSDNFSKISKDHKNGI